MESVETLGRGADGGRSGEDNKKQIKEKKDMAVQEKEKLDSLQDLGVEMEDVQHQLKTMSEQNKVVSIDGMEASPILLLEFFEYLKELSRIRLKKHQRIGIEEALKRKAEGRGRYGRPKASIPEDFSERIREYKANGERLSRYCEELQMKKATFYKYVKESLQER